MNRILAIVITGFWIVMWSLLLRTHLEPQNAALLQVPVEHVMKLFFHHQQQSDLFLRGDGGRIGHVKFHPYIRKEDGQRMIDLSGNVQLQIPGAAKQRIGWEGTAELSPTFQMERLRLRTSAREASAALVPENTAYIEYDGPTRVVSYELKLGNQTIDEHQLTADEAGIRNLLERSGVDAQLLQFANVKSEGSSASVSAQRSNLRIKDDKVDTLLVSIQVNGQTMLEFHVSQLGQILHAKTLTGWTLQAE